ncbi:MAG: hypothetical protein L6R38_006023 [Xanthoria sp. 2 TBL-2021]|nr:MAG: hypothetical protein L6R38_006023 [Xanthoria sp. 2 TBL-2021]
MAPPSNPPVVYQTKHFSYTFDPSTIPEAHRTPQQVEATCTKTKRLLDDLSGLDSLAALLRGRQGIPQHLITKENEKVWKKAVENGDLRLWRQHVTDLLLKIGLLHAELEQLTRQIFDV